MRLRHRLLTSFVVAHLGLTLVLGALAWWWLDRNRRQEAEASAGAVGRVLAQGGFSLTPEVLGRMRLLTGYDFALVEPDAPAPSGTVRVAAAGRTIEVAYRTPAYVAAEGALAWAVLAWTVAGTLAFAGVAVWQARRVARPVEDLAGAARRLGEGAWAEPVAVGGEGEVRALAEEVEALRRRLVDLLAQAQRAERLATLGGFTATIAHEVRNPLSAVRLMVQELARRHPGEVALALIGEEVERLDLIVDELLGFSRGMSVTPAPVDLAEVAAHVVRLLTRQADHLGVALTLMGTAPPVLADGQRLRQLLINLVLNAVQAAARGSASAPRVLVGVEPGGLVVEDNGPGVPEAQVASLFTPFASGRPEGTGLGLHLAQAIASAHGAALTYEPPPGGGARFRLSGLAAAAAGS